MTKFVNKTSGNIVKEGKNASNQHFFLSPQCFGRPLKNNVERGENASFLHLLAVTHVFQHFGISFELCF